MKPPAERLPLDLGPALVQRLLPQRPPFLMVDRIDAIAPGPEPRIWAARFLTANEAMYGGHFPELPILPGAMMFEGLGQSASLLFTLLRIAEAYESEGKSWDNLAADLQSLERRFRLQPGPQSQPSSILEQAFQHLAGLPVGVAGAVQLKFLEPVVPGCRLDYDVVLKRQFGDQLHFLLEASVAGRLVASGSLSAAVVQDSPLRG